MYGRYISYSWAFFSHNWGGTTLWWIHFTGKNLNFTILCKGNIWKKSNQNCTNHQLQHDLSNRKWGSTGNEIFAVNEHQCLLNQHTGNDGDMMAIWSTTQLQSGAPVYSLKLSWCKLLGFARLYGSNHYSRQINFQFWLLPYIGVDFRMLIKYMVAAFYFGGQHSRSSE